MALENSLVLLVWVVRSIDLHPLGPAGLAVSLSLTKSASLSVDIYRACWLRAPGDVPYIQQLPEHPPLVASLSHPATLARQLLGIFRYVPCVSAAAKTSAGNVTRHSAANGFAYVLLPCSLGSNSYDQMKRLPFVFLMCCIITAADGATYYVSPVGSDANSGSQNAPWLTLSYAVSAAASGDIVYVGPGHYNTDGVDFRPLHLNVSGQTFIGTNGCYTKQLFFEAPNVVFRNFVVGETHYGGADTDPVAWFKPGSDGSRLENGMVYSAAGRQQYGIIFAANFCTASNVEITAFGPSGICVETGGNSNNIVNCFMHDNGSCEGVFYIWGNYNLIASCTLSNNNELELPGSHPDLFQSFYGESWGTVISNNLAINNSCQFGSLQSCNGSGYWTNAGNWTFVNNVFINTGSKLDVDFRDVRFINNTFYNSCDNSDASQVINFNFSSEGSGTNGVMINNLFVLCGADPTLTDHGWFSADGPCVPTMTVSNNWVVGTGFAAKNPTLFFGTNWVNGGNPKFLNAPSSRIHQFNLTGTTGANNTTNIIGTGTSFTTELAVGDRIRLGPFWNGAEGKVIAIISATNLWTDVPIGTGVSTKYGGAQSIQRSQNYDPMPDLRLLAGSLAIGAGASLSNPAFDKAGIARPIGSPYTIGAYEGATAEVVPTNMILHITFNNWGGGTNALDSTTNRCDAAVAGAHAPSSGIGPDGGASAHISVTNSGYFGITNVATLRNLTNGSVAVWAKRDLTTGYSYILDCGYTYPATNGWTLGKDNGSSTKLYVAGPDSARNVVLTWADYQSTDWHHFAFTWSNAVTVGYYDGLPFQTNALPSQVITLDDADWLCVGAIQHDSPFGDATYPNAAFLNGSMTDLRMYNTALSATEVLNVYYVSASPQPTVNTTPTPGGSLPPQLLMHLNFTNWYGITNVLDQTTNHANAIAIGTNGPTLVEGPFITNSAAHFATDQWLAVTNISVFEYLTNGTIGMWINFDNPVGSGDYYAMDGWYAYPNTNCFWIGAPFGNSSNARLLANSSTYQTLTFSDWGANNSWHHYGITWDGRNVVCYFDGIPFLTNSQVVPFLHVESTSRWLALGVQHGSHTADSPSGGWLNGSLADVRFYNYALTPPNLARLVRYQEPLPINPRPSPPGGLRIANN